MIELDEHFILIPKGAGNFYEIHLKMKSLLRPSWGGQIVYQYSQTNFY